MNKKVSFIYLCAVAGLLVGMPQGGLLAGRAEKEPVDTGLGPERSPYKYRLNLQTGIDSRAKTDAFGDDVESAFTNINAGVARAFGTPRTRINFDLSAGTNYFWDVDQDDTDIDLRLSATVNHQLTRRVDVSFNTIATYQVEPDFFSGTGRSQRSGQYFYTNNALQIGWVWTRKFSTVTSYSLAATQYEEEEFAAAEDRIEQYLAQEFRYLLLPTTTIVAEYRYGMVEYDQNPSSSTSHYVLGGVDYTANRRLTVSLRGGAELREFDDGATAESPYGEATIAYAYGEGSALSWITRYGFENSQIFGTRTNTTLRTGLQITQKITGKLSGRLGLYYENTQFDSVDEDRTIIDPATGKEIPSDFDPDYSEDLIDFTAGLSYALHRNVALSLGYSLTTVASDQPANDYDRHRVMLGVNFSF